MAKVIGNCKHPVLKEYAVCLLLGMVFQGSVLAQSSSTYHFEDNAVNWDAITLPARCDLGRSLMEQGEYGAASHEFEKALAMGGDAFFLHAMMSTSYLLNGDVSRAKSHLSAAHRLQPKNPDLLALEGQFEIALGDTQKGEELLEELVALAPESMEPRLILARSYLQREEADLAVPHLDVLHRMTEGPTATLVKVMLSKCQGLKGFYASALLTAQEAFAEEPSMPEAIREWGLALIHVERYAEAKPFLERSWAMGPQDPQLAYALGVLHFSLGNWELAEAYWAKGNQLNPLAYPMAQRLIGLYLATGKIQSGQAVVDEVSRRFPHRVEAKLLEAFWARKLGKLAQAKHLLARLNRMPMNLEMIEDLKWEMAQLEFETGHHQNCAKLVSGLVRRGVWVKEATLLEAKIAFYQNQRNEGERLQALAKNLPVQWPKAGALVAGLPVKATSGLAAVDSH